MDTSVALASRLRLRDCFRHYVLLSYRSCIMFVQRPQTTHVPRHYTNTVRKTNNKNVDKENAGALPSKTPSKGVLKVGTGMLVPNTVRLGKSTMDAKGKGKEDDIGMLSFLL